MTGAPDRATVKAYLGDNNSWGDTVVDSALAAEMAAQARACTIPVDLTDPLNPVLVYPADLVEALCRRVAANLANRNVPLGVQTQVAEFGGTATRVGGLDREVRRLEGPYRKVIFG